MRKKIKIYGERNTNTGYIEHLIHLNLDVFQLRGIVPSLINTLQGKVRRLLPENETLNDIYFRLTYSENLGWKHTRVESAEKLKGYKLVDRDLCFLTITKNPYSWLLSLYRRPYHQYYRTLPSFEVFLQEQWKTVDRENCDKFVKNPVELWNLKNRSYLQLNEFNVLNITSEDIFRNPEAIVEKIARSFSINRVSSKFIDYDRSTKETDKDSQYYRDYYLNERWRDNLSDMAIAIVNESVDVELMSHFGYSLLT